MNDDDMIRSATSKEGIKVGGYKVNNLFLDEGISPYVTLNQRGGSPGTVVSSVFKHLAVPTGLLYLQHSVKNQKNPNIESSIEVVKDNLYDKLLFLVSAPSSHLKQSNKMKTKKNRKKRKNKTKRVK